jgi:4-diphosphocytidyl-2C-methyl-D-erythritol kinase
VNLPQDFWVVVALPRDAGKPSTAEIYRRYDELGGGPGFDERRAELLRLLAEVRRPADLAGLPANDLAVASGAAGAASELREAGAFRSDVSGAGPAVYGLFETRSEARSAARLLGRRARAWVAAAVW